MDELLTRSVCLPVYPTLSMTRITRILLTFYRLRIILTDMHTWSITLRDLLGLMCCRYMMFLVDSQRRGRLVESFMVVVMLVIMIIAMMSRLTIRIVTSFLHCSCNSTSPATRGVLTSSPDPSRSTSLISTRNLPLSSARLTGTPLQSDMPTRSILLSERVMCI